MHLAVEPRQVDPVAPVGRDREGGLELGARGCHREALLAVDHQLTPVGGDVGEHLHRHLGAAHRADVPALLERHRPEAGVRRVRHRQFQALDHRHPHDLDPVRRRAHPVGRDGVLDAVT
jgi:hypothetical protein